MQTEKLTESQIIAHAHISNLQHSRLIKKIFCEKFLLDEVNIN